MVIIHERSFTKSNRRLEARRREVQIQNGTILKAAENFFDHQFPLFIITNGNTNSQKETAELLPGGYLYKLIDGADAITSGLTIQQELATFYVRRVHNVALALKLSKKTPCLSLFIIAPADAELPVIPSEEIRSHFLASNRAELAAALGRIEIC